MVGVDDVDESRCQGMRCACVIQCMYSDARSSVRINGQYSEGFGVGVGVHQSYILSPLLFILVL